MKKIMPVLILLIVQFSLNSAADQLQAALLDSSEQGNKKTHLQETQSLMVKRGFLLIKPKNEGFLEAHESLENFVKIESQDNVLVAARQLFPDRDTYLNALAACAENEKYPAFAALLYNRQFEERRLNELQIVHCEGLKRREQSALKDALCIGGVAFILGLTATAYLIKIKR